MAINKDIEPVLKKMCSIAKVDYKTVDPTKKDWFLKHTWTLTQQDKFREWFIDYLYTNTKARNEIMQYPVKNKGLINSLVNMFILDYGWKVKDE